MQSRRNIRRADIAAEIWEKKVYVLFDRYCDDVRA